MAKLVCQTGPTAGHEYPLTKDVTTLGRQSSCDIQILDNMSSRVNCQVRRDGKLFTLVDLGSRNGTNLNGKKVTERQLTFGDRIRIGEVEYLFVKEPGDVELKDLLSKYEVQEKIGEGGMGIVYKANQRSMNRIVALKILSPKYSTRPRFVEQFIREARAAGQLNHPNIIQVHDVGTENDIHYFSMEFVDGPTCMQALRQQGPFKTPEALEIIRQTARALEYAHGQRLIHQDIKPDNIMLGHNNTVKLADLGISKTFDEAESEEGPKRVMGTPHYMAPEAALGKKIDHRVDIYSLGATLYHLLTGKTPYSGTSATEVLKAQVMDPLPPIQDMVADVPEAVCALVERMVAKKPDDRYPSATQVVEEVQRLQAGIGLGTERIGGGETMLLRRFAAGAPATGMLTPLAFPTTNTRTPTRDDDATSERPVRRAAKPPYEAILVVVIAVVVIVIAIHLLSNVKVDSDPRDKPGASKDQTQHQSGSVDTDVQTPVSDQNNQRHLTALAAIEEKLKAPPDQIDLDTLRKQVDTLMADKLQPAQHDHAAALLDRIAGMTQHRVDQAIETDFEALKVAVEKMRDDHDFQGAFNRLDSFKDKDAKVIKDRLGDLRDDVQHSKDAFLEGLHNLAQTYMSSRSLKDLQELRDKLPPSLLNTPTEKEIADDIKQLSDRVAAQQQQVLAKAASELVHWNFSNLDDIISDARPGMGSSEAGKRLDLYQEASHRLARLPHAITDAVPPGTLRLPLFHGTVNRWSDPYIMGADASSLTIQVDGGGTASVNWADIAPDVLWDIVRLVLKDDSEPYHSAINVLATARAVEEKDKVKGNGKDKE